MALRVEREIPALVDVRDRAEPREMRMRYGLNQADECWDFALGEDRAQIQQRIRDLDTRVIRIFLFDKGGPDPIKDWAMFVSFVEAVRAVGAVPMITFAKFHRPFDDPRAVRWFAEQCADVAWGCIEHWGGEEVRDWYWCVWNEPNSDWIGGGLTFETYRPIYEAVARGVSRWLSPYLGGRKPLIGGPAIEGFQPFWWDWAWRFVNEIDNSLIGFLDWHCYGDWREDGENGAPTDPALHRRLMMGQTSDYQSRARAMGVLLAGRDIENVCGELNTHSHYWDHVRARFNQSVFGAAFYVSALLHLIKGGVDIEMYWTGTEETGGYGMMDRHGNPWPVYHAKRLCAQHIRRGDAIWFPPERSDPPLDIAVARADDGRRSTLLVHRRESAATYDLAKLGADVGDAATVLQMDQGTGNTIENGGYDGLITFEGYGVAVVTDGHPQDGDASR